MKRIPTEQLFRPTANGLEAVSDDTIRRLLDASERRQLEGYRQAVADEMIQTPEAV